MKDEADYDRYAYAALTKGYPGEAKPSSKRASRPAPSMSTKRRSRKRWRRRSEVGGEEATLDAAATKAIASGTAKSA